MLLLIEMQCHYIEIVILQGNQFLAFIMLAETVFTFSSVRWAVYNTEYLILMLQMLIFYF